MYDVVGVRFKKAGKIYYFDPGELTIPDGEFVIVETVRGVEFGRVVINKKQVSENDVVLPCFLLITTLPNSTPRTVSTITNSPSGIVSSPGSK